MVGRRRGSTHRINVRAFSDCVPLAAAMEKRHLNKSAFARQLKTSRSQLDRLLDPDNTKVTLDALARAAHAVGRELQLKLR